MYHSETFRNRTPSVDLVEIVNEVASQLVLALKLVDLVDFVCVFVFSHSIPKSFFAFHEMVFVFVVLIGVFALAGITCVDFGFINSLLAKESRYLASCIELLE